MNYEYHFLDDDLYKFTQQQAVLEKFPNANAVYHFINRRPTNKFTEYFMKVFHERLNEFKNLTLKDDECEFLRKTGYFKDSYLRYLKDYRFDPNEVYATLIDENLNITISGKWHKTILWEVRLMAMISQTYFEVCDINWDNDNQINHFTQKCINFVKNDLSVIEFGTRRRRSFETQKTIINFDVENEKVLIGTSNVHFAMKYDINVVGTFAHEWVMGNSALCSLRHANKHALENWADVYNGQLGIALTDTYTTDVFLKDFDSKLSRLYDGVRHDSGDPLIFADKMVEHYKKLGIKPSTKKIIFSDGLNTKKCIDIAKYCEKIRIGCVFGVGTDLTNDFQNSPALNMVIKLYSIDNINVVKLSDAPTKATGEESALAEAQYVFFNKPIKVIL